VRRRGRDRARVRRPRRGDRAAADRAGGGAGVIRSPQQRTDAAIALIVAVLIGSEIATSPVIDGPVWANMVVLLPAGGGLAWRRPPLIPLVALAVSSLLSGLILPDIEQLSTTIVPPLLAAYAVGRYAADARPLAVLLALTVAGVNLL